MNIDATVSTGNPEQPLTRDEALRSAGRFLAERAAHPAGRYTTGHMRFVQALIAYAAELRQNGPAATDLRPYYYEQYGKAAATQDTAWDASVASQESAGGTEPFRVGICVCGAEWWSDSKPYVDAKNGQVHHLGHRT